MPLTFGTQNLIKHYAHVPYSVHTYRPFPPDKTAIPPSKQTPAAAANVQDKNINIPFINIILSQVRFLNIP
jgi:hypothetical protein